MNPRGTPQRIRRRELTNQGTHLHRYTRTAGVASALPRPEQAKAAPVPPDDRLRSHDVKRRAPAAPDARETRPEEAVCWRETKTRTARPMDHRELVSERHDFEVQRRARADEGSQRVEQRSEDGDHGGSLSKDAGNLKRRNTYGVSGRRQVHTPS